MVRSRVPFDVTAVALNADIAVTGFAANRVGPAVAYNHIVTRPGSDRILIALGYHVIMPSARVDEIVGTSTDSGVAPGACEDAGPINMVDHHVVSGPVSIVSLWNSADVPDQASLPSTSRVHSGHRRAERAPGHRRNQSIEECRPAAQKPAPLFA